MTMQWMTQKTRDWATWTTKTTRMNSGSADGKAFLLH